MVLSLMLLSGCDFLKKKETPAPKTTAQAAEAGASLCTINGETVITESEFMNNLVQMIQSNPYFKGASLDSLPKELLRKFFDQLTTQALIEKFSVKTNVEKDPEFVKAYNETEKLLKRSLMVQLFEKKIYDNIKVSDGDISKHYSENKDRFVKVAGGTLAMGARFENEEAANAFLAKAKANMDDFENMAKKDGKFRDFGRVTKESRGMQYEVVPGPIKDTVLSANKLPMVDKVKTGKEFWVVKAWDKKDTTLFDLDEVKPHIEAMLKNNLFRDALEKRVKELNSEFTVVVNEDFFKDKAAPGQAQGDDEAQEPKENNAATAA